MKPQINLVGHSFGYWTVKRKIDHHKHGDTRWFCVCTCGAYSEIRTSDLIKNRSTKCFACARAQRTRDFRGQTRGLWMVLERTDSDKNGYTRWLCECTCGKRQKVRTNQLNKDDDQIGCRSCSKLKRSKRDPFDVAIYTIKANLYRRNNITLSVTKEYIQRLYAEQQGRCALSGVNLYLGKTYKEHNEKRLTTASLDRIDSTKSYSEGNVQWIHKDLQAMKMAMKQDDFLSWIKRIYLFQNTPVTRTAQDAELS
jgi:hypothetical protein